MDSEEADDAMAFTDMLLQDVKEGRETASSIKGLRDAEAYMFRLVAKDPECSAFHSACTTVLYLLDNGSVL